MLHEAYHPAQSFDGDIDGDNNIDMSVLDGGLAPPPLPVDVFGPFWAQWITGHAAQASVPPDYVAAPLLGVAAAALGNARAVSPWDGFVQPSVLWLAKVGLPSSGKTPSDDAVLSLVTRLEVEMAEGFDETLRQYETDALAAKLAKEVWEQEVRDAVENGYEPPIMPESASLPTKPIRPRLKVADTTPEAMGMLMEVHPKGLMLHRDELAGFLGGFDRYVRAGSERAFWSEAFNGSYYVVDRVKHPEPIRIPHLAVSIIGGIQPDRLNSLLLSGDDDGLPARFLMVWPEPLPPQRPTTTINNDMAYVALKRLHGIEMGVGADGQPARVIAALTDEAAEKFQCWRDEHFENQPSSGMFASHYGKLPGVVLRLALVIEFLWWAVEGARQKVESDFPWLRQSGEAPQGEQNGVPWMTSSPPPSRIGVMATTAAITLVTDYFLPMARRAYGDAALPDDERGGRTIARWILKKNISRFNASELRRKEKLPGLRKANDIQASLKFLVEAGWIWPMPSREGDKPGRQRADYMVSPKLRVEP